MKWRGEKVDMASVATSRILTYVDSSVLINAIVGSNAARKMRALSVLGDPRRDFVATCYLTLEVIPLPTRFQRLRELSFYERFFDKITVWIDETPLLPLAMTWACQHGLGAIDALHLVAASTANAEFISAEKPTKPLYSAYAQASSIY